MYVAMIRGYEEILNQILRFFMYKKTLADIEARLNAYID